MTLCIVGAKNILDGDSHEIKLINTIRQLTTFDSAFRARVSRFTGNAAPTMRKAVCAIKDELEVSAEIRGKWNRVGTAFAVKRRVWFLGQRPHKIDCVALGLGVRLC